MESEVFKMDDSTRVLTETTCFACAGKGWVPDKSKKGHVWDCPTCKGQKVTRRAVTLAELRNALAWTVAPCPWPLEGEDGK